MASEQIGGIKRKLYISEIAKAESIQRLKLLHFNTNNDCLYQMIYYLMYYGITLGILRLPMSTHSHGIILQYEILFTKTKRVSFREQVVGQNPMQAQ